MDDMKLFPTSSLTTMLNFIVVSHRAENESQFMTHMTHKLVDP